MTMMLGRAGAGAGCHPPTPDAAHTATTPIIALSRVMSAPGWVRIMDHPPRDPALPASAISFASMRAAIPLDDLADIFAVPPLPRRGDARRTLNLDAAECVARHIEAGGITRFLYGG